MPEALEDDHALNCPSSDEVVETDRRPAVGFKENHKEAVTNKHHHMNVLPHGILGPHRFLGVSVLFCNNVGISFICVSTHVVSCSNAVKHNHDSFREEK